MFKYGLKLYLQNYYVSTNNNISSKFIFYLRKQNKIKYEKHQVVWYCKREINEETVGQSWEAQPVYIIKGNVPAEKQSTTFFGEEIF